MNAPFSQKKSFVNSVHIFFREPIDRILNKRLYVRIVYACFRLMRLYYQVVDAFTRSS